MSYLISRTTGRFVFLLMVVLIGVTMILTPPAQARRFLSDGSGDGIEGDPLDGNDFGGGGGGLVGDDIHDNYKFVGAGGGGLVIAGPRRETQVFLIVDFRGMVPVLRVVRVAGSVVLAEDRDAR